MLTGNTHDDFLRLEKRLKKLERKDSVAPPEAWIPMDAATYLGTGWSGSTDAYAPMYYKDRERVYFKGNLVYSSGGQPGVPIKFMPPGYRIAGTNSGGAMAVIVPQGNLGLVATSFGGPRLLDLGASNGAMQIVLGGAVPNTSIWRLDLISYRVPPL